MSQGKKDESKRSSKESPYNDSYKGISPPVIELPEGRGAIKNIDEMFSVNAVNSTPFFNFQLPFSSSGAMTRGQPGAT